MRQNSFGKLWPVSALTLGGGGIGMVWGETTFGECIATVHEAVAASPPACRNPQVVPGWAQTPSPASRFAPDSLLEGTGFEPSVPPRRERLWAATPGKHCRFGPEPVSGSAFRAAVSDWQRPESLSQERDRWFESGSLHRGVIWEPDFLDQGADRRNLVSASN
jgi:hypothetical protein